MTEDQIMNAYAYTRSVAAENGHPDPTRVAVTAIADVARQEAAQESIELLKLDYPAAAQAVTEHFQFGGDAE